MFLLENESLERDDECLIVHFILFLKHHKKSPISFNIGD